MRTFSNHLISIVILILLSVCHAWSNVNQESVSNDWQLTDSATETPQLMSDLTLNTDQYTLETDSLALVALYNATNGPNWTNNENWLIGPVSTWYGVTVLNDRVISLQLPGNQLSGSIPAEIGNLTKLQKLNLRGNQLSGVIPVEIGNLKNLDNLELRTNQLSGSIPLEIGNLIKLRSLFLEQNQLSGSIPVEIGNLTGILLLDLRSNQLSGSIPSEIGNLTYLNWLSLSNNQLSGSLPSEIGNTNVSYLYLANNQLSGSIPVEIGNLTILKDLNIIVNRFDSLPDLSNLPSLTNLACGYNKLTFSDLEPNIGITNFSYLFQDSVGIRIDTSIYVGLNFIYRLQTGGEFNQYQWFKNGAALPGQTTSNLTIQGVQLSDAGNYYCQVTNTVVTGLTLTSRMLTLGVIDIEPLELDSLALVDLYNATDGPNWNNNTNWLSGPVNTWYGVTVTNGTVTDLNLGGNNLVGIIPASIGNLLNLETLNFSINKLNGNIPSSLFYLKNLKVLFLDNNLLTGRIPSEIENLSSIEHLWLFHNLFEGEIPSSIGNLAMLRSLNLANNHFSGDFPVELTNLTRLQSLSIQENMFTSLPNMGILPELSSLDCYTNQLDFADLEPIVGLTSFRYAPQDSIDTAIDTVVVYATNFYHELKTGGVHNQYQWFKEGVALSGQNTPNLIIPSVQYSDAGRYHCQVTNTLVTGLTLNSRILTLEVITPIEFDSLALVDLYNATDGPNWNNNTNWLTGPLNTWHGVTVTNERVTGLSLETNNLVGMIPPSIGNLTKLTNLDLRSNNFSGEIPPEIGNLLNLYSLNLYSNQLAGEIPPELGNLINLEGLMLYDNQLTGVLPPSLFNLSNLSILRLDRNQLSGSISVEIGNLINLSDLNLRNNQFEGAVPSSIGNLSSLVKLELAYNQFSVDLPVEITNLTKLQSLRIEGNLFSSLPNLGILPEFNSLICHTNKLDFTDLEPYVNLPEFNCYPQDSIGRAIDTLLIAGSDFSYEMKTGGSNISYKWYKYGTEVSTGTSPLLTIQNVQPSDAGNYNCVVYSNLLGMELISRTLYLNVQDPPTDGCYQVATIEDWKSFDFSTATQGNSVTGGDFYFLDDGSLKFWANNTGQRGLIDLGDLGDIPLYQVQIPESGYNQFGVDAVAGHTYVSQAAEGEEENFIVFRVLDVNSSRAVVAYSYQHRYRATLANGNSYDFSEHVISGDWIGGDLYFDGGSLNFYANNLGQNGTRSMGDIGNLPLNQVSIPETGYSTQGVSAVECHTYVSLAADGEEGSYIVFRVLNVSDTEITLDYFYRNRYDYIYADAGPDQTVPEGAQVTLDGTGSADPDNLPLQYQWIAPSGIQMSSYTDPSPTFSAPVVTGLTNTKYTFYLTVSNGTKTSMKDQVNIFVAKDVQFAGGSGTIEDPWLIATAQQLHDMRYRLNGYFKQVADIDLGVAPWNEDEGWLPIGVYGNFETGEGFFTGSYDGNGYKIMNLTINRPLTSSVGLFGAIGKFDGESLFQDISLTNVHVTGNYWVGSIAGMFDRQATLVRCSASGSVSSGSVAGGLVGFCSNFSRIDQSYFNGIVSGDNSVGGITGYLRGDIINSYASGSVSGTMYAGGLAGQYHSGFLMNSYSNALVTGESYTGGLVGMTTLPSNYFLYCFWDNETSPQATSGGGTGKTSVEMIRQATFTGWDFDQVWKIEENRSYPYLAWQLYPAPHNMHPNHPPVAHAGDALSADEWAMISLDASLSTDEDGDTLTYRWTAPDGIMLNADTSANPTFIAPSVETDKTFTFWLVVNDGIIDSEPASVSVTVKNISNPVVNYPSAPNIIWEPDTIYEITWLEFLDPYVKLELLKGETVVRTITSGTANDGTMLWRAPSLEPGTDYRIRITSTITPSMSDISDNYFTLAPPISPKISYPSDPAIVWNPGEIYEITWQDFTDPYVKLELLKGETVVRTITTGTANDGTMLWRAPAIEPGADYRIRITSTATPSMTDLSDNFFAIQPAAMPNVIYPSEPALVWNPGTIYEILWQDFTDPYVKIELLKGSTVVRTVTTATANDGTMLWRAPSIDPGAFYRIRITSTVNPGLSDVSDNFFAIQPAAMPNVIYPSESGLVWNPGTIYEILWQDFTDPYVKIELLKGAAVVRTVTTGTANDGTMLWRAPTLESGTDYRIRITSTVNPSMTDISDAYFALQPSASPRISYPSESGITWTPGTIYEITWQDFTDPYVKIELLKGSTVVRTVTTATANDGTMLWRAPALESGNDYRIRITSTVNPSMTDISDNAFHISGPPQVSYPSASGITWNTGTIYEITWQDFTDPYVKVELLKGETVVRTITTATANDGAMLWRIATTLEPGNDYRVRITSTVNPGMTDVSDNPLTIVVPKSATAFGDDPYSNSLSVYPNPFSQRATITYTLAEPGRTLLEIYDLTGRRVTILEDATREAGTYVMEWNATDANGQQVVPGMYLVRIQSGGFVETSKLVKNY